MQRERERLKIRTITDFTPGTAKSLLRQDLAESPQNRRCQRWFRPNRQRFSQQRPPSHLPPWLSRGSRLTRLCRPGQERNVAGVE